MTVNDRQKAKTLNVHCGEMLVAHVECRIAVLASQREEVSLVIVGVIRQQIVENIVHRFSFE